MARTACTWLTLVRIAHDFLTAAGSYRRNVQEDAPGTCGAIQATSLITSYLREHGRIESCKQH
jgi:hypothetical protein